MQTHAVAMHMSDGLVNGPTALLFGVVAVGALALAVVRARADLTTGRPRWPGW
ncbi:Substrate-specific component NikM of nickel ECF transporter [Pseudonocardia sp. Ae168_Ps1]|nr:Substrate-specific component NikM of nickel ECF transporter [Pseudonocardia sp. Ae150A_Ps1]OLL78145.1 Substrate-specific component NikM of nickel ECF transporter [Pseudonocardia sp. Ae168_Ps1]OLL87732.1 Substrate-specific component NikM of nickel ECF transporter [Pseudonocardia sp. Ae263_Ps1]OLL92241.1 Substrate-specific component NikM of nickel ECF transporter [Pseudonocardia sp. Ae356_Ps1]